jgi:ornithine carbamoyltransferase
MIFEKPTLRTESVRASMVHLKVTPSISAPAMVVLGHREPAEKDVAGVLAPRWVDIITARWVCS